MSISSKPMQNPAAAPSDSLLERPEKSEQKPIASFVKKNMIPVAIGSGIAAAGAAHLLFSGKIQNLLNPKKKHKHSHGLSFGRLGALAGAASVIHTVVHPFTCGGSGMFFGGAALLSSFLPKLWGGKSKGSSCGHSHHHAKPAPAPAVLPTPVK